MLNADTSESSNTDEQRESAVQISRSELTNLLAVVGFACYWACMAALFSQLFFSVVPFAPPAAPSLDMGRPAVLHSEALSADLFTRAAIVATMAALMLILHLYLAHFSKQVRFGRGSIILSALCALPLLAVLVYRQFVDQPGIPLMFVSAIPFGVSASIVFLSWGTILSYIDQIRSFNRNTASSLGWIILTAALLLLVVWFAPAKMPLLATLLLFFVSLSLLVVCSHRLRRPQENQPHQDQKRIKLFSRSRYFPLAMGLSFGGLLAYANIAVLPLLNLLVFAGGLAAGGAVAIISIAILKRVPLLRTIERICLPLLAATGIALLYLPPPPVADTLLITSLVLTVAIAALTMYFILHLNIHLLLSYKHHLEPIDHFSQGTVAPLEGIAIGLAVPALATWAGVSPEEFKLPAILALLFVLILFPAIANNRSNQAVEALSLSEARGLTVLPEAEDIEEARRCAASQPKGAWRNRCLYIVKKHGLSPREAEVFLLLAKGRNAEHIHNELFISIYTAKTHGYRIYRKLGVNSQQELIDLVDSAEVPEGFASAESGRESRGGA
ncbi:MAG: helix-turn-helix transcriptional regulator [Coriobacteriales bacterium]|jgi:DNA-binding CsgD family transcriptional regulator|nr:helix-turn-helix transcriptional regulator [Coriobacteriales bacterium]